MMVYPAKLKDVTPESVLARFEGGETVAEIAEALNVHETSLYRLLIAEAPDQWREFQAARALTEYAAAEKHLRACHGPVEIARARELIKSQCWKLERVLSRIYGNQEAGRQLAQVHINISLKREPVGNAVIEAVEPSE